jgi:hypothetical protein
MRTALALVIVFVVITPAAADIVLQSSPGTPLPAGNLVQYTITAVGTEGERINVFSNPDIRAAGLGAGVHQVWSQDADGDLPTPTEQEHLDEVGQFNADWAAYDTYYLFRDSEEIGSLGPPLTETNDRSTTGTLGLTKASGFDAPSGFGTLSLSSPGLGSSLVLPQFQGPNVPFMQVVLKQGEQALMDVRVVGDAGTAVQNFQDFIIGSTSGLVAVPDAVLGDTGAAIIRHTFQPTSGDPPFTWSLSPATGLPFLPATINSNTGEFEWNTLGSPRPGMYSWTITAMNAAGSDTAVLSVNLIPEPAPMMLAALTLVGLAPFRCCRLPTH